MEYKYIPCPCCDGTGMMQWHKMSRVVNMMDVTCNDCDGSGRLLIIVNKKTTDI